MSPCHTGSCSNAMSPCHTGSCSHAMSPCHTGSCSNAMSPCCTGSCSNAMSPCCTGSCSNAMSPCHTGSCSNVMSPCRTGSCIAMQFLPILLRWEAKVSAISPFRNWPWELWQCNSPMQSRWELYIAMQSARLGDVALNRHSPWALALSRCTGRRRSLTQCNFSLSRWEL